MRFNLRTISMLVPITALVSLGLATAAPAAVSEPAGQPPAAEIVAKPPKITGKACKGETGVTVVVDFRTLRNLSGKKMNLVKIGCARGAQESGFTALLDAGFDVNPESPFVCKIDNRPLDSPSCPAPDGFWSYSHGERGGEWELSGTGAGGWQPPPGSLEGWSWSPYDQDWAFPRVTPSDLFPPLG